MASQGKPSDTRPPKSGKRGAAKNTPGSGVARPLIVGIGASAGGLEAFKSFFANMPSDSDMVFILVQHLAPDHTSLLAELLGRTTSMPVREAVDGARVEPRHVYVIPPNATLTLAQRVLKVTSPAPPREHRWPINTFFTSLAQDQGDCAVCVVLAGTGSDGSEGLRVVKEHGGLALAQSGVDEVALSGMPASAVATGLVDAVLPVEEMPGRLLTYQKDLLSAHRSQDGDGVRKDVGQHLQAISELVRTETGHDFSQYKEKTLMRRIQRRMLVAQTDTVPNYIDYLREHTSERELLFREFLIGVTEFFRDPAAYETLRSIAIPSILADKDHSDEVRVWVPGCATGEEAYSIAITLREAMNGARGPRVRIFATDIDDVAIARARTGRFRAPLSGISPERQERWFRQDQNDYCVVKSIRDMCIFSPHSVIKDPPFSRMDLVSCRNLLIYLNSDLQERLLQSFHYALRSGGFLLLGPSERLGGSARLFNEVDKKQRLYIRRDDVGAPARQVAETRRSRHSETTSHVASRQMDDLIDQHARLALEPWSPAYVVVDANHEVLRFGGDTRRYLAPSSGVASLNLFQLLDKSLRSVVRSAVMQAFASGQPVVRDDSQLASSHDRPLRLIVEPLPLPATMQPGGEDHVQLCVVAFQQLESAPSVVPAAPGAEVDSAVGRIQALENELRATRMQLQSTINLHETASEDLKSAVEEYQSVNEELQSANEELETSSEEMQSINEELQTVNTEVQSKNDALNQVNSDIRNLLDSTHIATLFLDRELRIRSYTPAMTDLFHLRDGDKGRPITEIAARTNYPQLREDVTRVLRETTVIERILSGSDEDVTFILRLRPYVTIDNIIDGVVLTGVDITDNNQRLNREHARSAAIVTASPDAIIGLLPDDRIMSWNPAAERIFGLHAAQMIGQSLRKLLPPEASSEARQFFTSKAERELSCEFEMVWQRPAGEAVPLAMTYAPVLSNNGARRLVAGQLIARDITADRRAKDHARMMMGELNHRVKNTLATVQAIVLQSATTALDVPTFKNDFLARLMALSDTHNLLASSAWEGASLSDIVKREVGPWQDDATTDQPRVRVSGDDIQLHPKEALVLSMALHELTTNAAKYGALSVRPGQVAVTWSTRTVRDSLWLSLQWSERDGPTVTQPEHTGFGSRLIRDGVAYELGGQVRLEMPATGVTCIIDIPLGEAH